MNFFLFMTNLQYFSSGLAQNGSDGQFNTINGFLLEDISKELRRGLRLLCSGCNKPGGYVGCAVNTCKKAGHFPCLQRLGYLFQYYGNFKAYCPDHHPTQPEFNCADMSSECCICLTKLNSSSSIYCPRCLTPFHRFCVQVYKCIYWYWMIVIR